MNFQQLRIIREAARCNFNFTQVSKNLYTSQSGISKHVMDLEDELGLAVFERKGKRILGLTGFGVELLKIIDRMLQDAKNIKQLADQFGNSDVGQLTIATTHTQARYTLPSIVGIFRERYPKVHLALHQASPLEIVDMLRHGQADIGIATESVTENPEIVTFPFYHWRHAVVVKKGHPLEKAKNLTLKEISKYPIVTYHTGFTGRAAIDATFSEAGLAPDIVLTALDADVIKTYVELGLGIGIIASIAFQIDRDTRLSLLEGKELFPQKTTYIAIRRNHYLRDFAYKFIEYASPELTSVKVRAALRPTSDLEID